MKKTFALGGIIITLFLGVAPMANAQTFTGPITSTPTAAGGAPDTSPPSQDFSTIVGNAVRDAVIYNPALNPIGATVHALGSVGDAADALTGNKGNSCGFLHPLNCLADILDWIIRLMGIVSWLVLWFSAHALDVTVQEFVIRMGHFITSASAAGIQTAWGVVRDLVNIGIIGGLIAVAIGTILQSSTYNANKLLARLIISALLVNFSYFFAGAIIDSSNYLATQIYASTIAGAPGCTIDTCSLTSRFVTATNFQSIQDDLKVQPTITQSAENGVQNALFGGALNPLGAVGAAGSLVTSVFNGNPGNTPAPINSWQSLFADILSIVFQAITTFVFLSALALLVGRFVALVFLLITSPIGIAGSAIPLISKYAKEWWEVLFAQAFFAPVYFLLVDFSFMILEGAKKGILADTGNSTVFGTMLTFIIASAFMLASLRIASSLSASGKTYLGDIYKGTGELLGWLPKGYVKGGKFLGAVTLRNTVGRYADKAEHAYREWAGQHRLDQFDLREHSFLGRIPGVRGATNALVRSGDRWAQEGIEHVREQKFFGFSSYKTEKEARKAREVLLGDVEKDEKQKGKLDGHLIGKEVGDYKQLKEKLTESELATYDRLVKKEEEKGLDDDEKRELAPLKARMSRSERARLREYERRQTVWGKDEHGEDERGELGMMNAAREGFDKLYNAGAKRIENPDGTLESLDAYWARQGTLGELGRQRVKNAKGEWEDEDLWAYHERMDKVKIPTVTVNGVTKDFGLSYRVARSNAEAIYGSISEGFFEREYDKDPRLIIPLARLLKPEQWKKNVVDNPKIRRDIKHEMWRSRRGEYAKTIQDVQDQLERGQLVRGSAEYGDALLAMYNYAAKNIKHEEFGDMILSDAEFDPKGHPGKKFEDLRATDALWIGSLSTSFKYVKDQKLLAETEMRDAGVFKRRPMDDARDEQAGAFRVLGYGNTAEGGDNNRNFLPYEDGTANYHAEERAQKWASDKITAMSRVIRNYDADPATHNNITAQTYNTAKEELRYAQMVKDGTAANPLGEEISDAQKAVDAAQVEAYVAAEAQKGYTISKGQAERELKDDAKGKIIREARERYEQEMKNIDAEVADIADPDSKTKRRAELEAETFKEGTKRGNVNFLMHRLAATEERAHGWYKGKNPDEVSAILNKRNYWSTASAYGIDPDHFQSIAGQDLGEREAFFKNFLARGDDSLIVNYASNDNLKQNFKWPPKNDMREINRIRRQLGKPELPVIFSVGEVSERLSGTNDDDDDEISALRRSRGGGGDDAGGDVGERSGLSRPFRPNPPPPNRPL